MCQAVTNVSSWILQIEEAEEATPSPEAHAFQSLNASSRQDEDQKSGKNGRALPETSVMEIPLEDLGASSKDKSTIGKVTEFLTGRGSSKKQSRVVERIQRSSSYSPQRIRTHSPGGGDATAGKAIRMSAGDKGRSRLDGRSGELRRPRAGSYPSPRRSAGGANSTVNTSQSSKVISTSFMVKPKKQTSESEVAARKESADGKKPDSKGHTRSRSNSSGTCPKTLTPAAEPKVSLMDNSDALPVAGLASPKLVPPAEPDRIRSFSDTSSVDSEISATQSSSSTSAVEPDSGSKSARTSQAQTSPTEPQSSTSLPAAETCETGQGKTRDPAAEEADQNAIE